MIEQGARDCYFLKSVLLAAAMRAFYNFHTGASVGLAVVEPCDPPFGWEAPVKTIDLAGASFEAAKRLSCLSILVSAASTLSTVCAWRKRQLPQKRERHGPTSLKRG